MNEIARLQGLLERTYSGSCFHGDSIAEIFNSIDAPTAIWIPEGGAHSIWQIVLHMTGWVNVIRQRLTSPTLVNLSAEENFPAPPAATPENWSATLDGFRDGLTALIEEIGRFPEEKLEKPVPGRSYTFDVLLHGIIHHSLYHAGQISLLQSMYKRKT
jgi:DinB superfamily